MLVILIELFYAWQSDRLVPDYYYSKISTPKANHYYKTGLNLLSREETSVKCLYKGDFQIIYIK